MFGLLFLSQKITSFFIYTYNNGAKSHFLLNCCQGISMDYQGIGIISPFTIDRVIKRNGLFRRYKAKIKHIRIRSIIIHQIHLKESKSLFIGFINDKIILFYSQLYRSLQQICIFRRP
ncbi:MAG: hypothetical protein KatS3mg002_1732 [Candidatus Woesearchaeota archaeon]|nr:MAG: hypothetical protein KatS3mg002_1732 [Candidatus Woesearchaeota archaeon]GIX42946.1 MAG: hypothetical protein KatS3mg129_2679 [Leptospiraceae bacterium]